MKQITDEQINSLIQVIYDLDAPVKTYQRVQKFLTSLPEVKEEPKEKKK